jgi:2-octaprenylphenol hydroxylase
MSRPDVVIVGAGITGASLALGLARVANQRVVLVDHRIPDESSEDVHSRVSALGLAAERVLSAIGVWQSLPAARLSPYRRMEIWDEGSSGRLEFDAAEIGEPHLGHIIENHLLLNHLHEAIGGTDLVSCRFGVEPSDISINEKGVKLGLEDDDVIEAALLVGADGGDSWVREELDISASTHEYQQLGIVCRIHTEFPHRKTAWQRFLATGPVAVLPMADGNSSIVWSADERKAQALLDLDESEFEAELGAALDGRLGEINLLDSRLAFPLKSMRVDQYITSRVVLVGDAAHRVHPLAGQGANLGLKDVAALTEVVQSADEDSRDIGNRLVLRQYERWRKTENTTVDFLMSALQKAFGSNHGIPGSIRGPAMNTLNSANSIKNLMARHAMGISGDLPRMIDPYR